MPFSSPPRRPSEIEFTSSTSSCARR
jgi:hypothetical protein